MAYNLSIEQMTRLYQFYAQQALIQRLTEPKDDTSESDGSDIEIKEEIQTKKRNSFSMASILGEETEESDDHCVPEGEPKSESILPVMPQFNPYIMWPQHQLTPALPLKPEPKTKRVRTIFTTMQIERLEAEFEKSQYNVGKDRVKLAQELNLSETQVCLYFPYQTKTKTYTLGESLVPKSPNQRS